ncbi:hypothetical protein MJO29_013250 [Puccinia striiformis f. sp. tritici]|uniref:Uncharacterized protein n=3 Tax=Puccinia striiformis TaxID=27350 RepID=A0A0L0VMA0_9BASI|nr:hypothetical protein Pst134EB_025337 [Puccinia striiformis f. sp. tritici]KAI9631400.1 hypothetical protein KEM48_014374 [Puccinia striiformis f. sp. tritici PST-130]KNF00404.1 hypothetical protein PSTG_06332 [Puccinia striiformis f. sp. tritici PST-78]POV97914.1 hypothetical protein PSHT_14320 [Puccinia striiformis]KAH9445090.1 hypothetical protein Pst134EB_025341 [Puccinia striiformis f. sp. tritici]
MKSVVYAACLLATFAVATPIEHQPRQAAVQSQSSSSSGSGAKSDYNANISPLGSSVSSSSSQYQYANQQSSTVVQAFPPIMGLLNTMQSQFAQGSLTQTAAASQMAQVAQMLGPALTQLNGCNCAGNAGVMSSASQAFQTMSSLMQSFSSRWGASSMGSIVSPIQTIAPALSSFYSSQQASSLKSSSSQSYTTSMAPLMGFVAPGSF